MNKMLKLCLIAVTGMGIGTIAKIKRPKHLPSLNGGKVIKKVNEEQYDSFIPSLKTDIVNELVIDQHDWLKDLVKWGTKEGVIEVGDLLYRKRAAKKILDIQEGRINNIGLPSHLKLEESYISDLAKWGTKEGIIEVSNDKKLKAKRSRVNIEKSGNDLLNQYLLNKPLPSKTQVTVTNNNSYPETIRLWGGNRDIVTQPNSGGDDGYDYDFERTNLAEGITIDDEYREKQQDFQHNPGLVKHVKFVLSGSERFDVLRVIEQNPTGTVQTKSISFSNYQNPLNSLNVSEVTELNNSIIDGKTEWEFTIAAKQTITMIIHYHQVGLYRLLPEKRPNQ